jgi:coenzyme F420-dependent glucose-6-phosphate dehydrogenase
VGHACFIWTLAGAAAARTSHIRLGTGVTCPILRYRPSIVAQAATTLTAMAPGPNLSRGGIGEALNEY